jgi:beta-phosphoglucomutase-like phosphatase (HAD superfamily)
MQTALTAPWGAIFDWDGVIIDSSRHHEESWERLAREESRTLPEGHFKAGSVGRMSSSSRRFSVGPRRFGD